MRCTCTKTKMLTQKLGIDLAVLAVVLVFDPMALLSVNP